ncbi:fibronectin type III domain-containing protein, partial [Klebsiella pneumoniae]|nr:fibronectin type III domain-containing protein [Klebsiella pneumoniae]
MEYGRRLGSREISCVLRVGRRLVWEERRQWDGWVGGCLEGCVDVDAPHCALSNSAVAEPEEEPTSPPTLGELVASQVTPDSVQLEWRVPKGTFDSFTVQYRDAQGQPQVLPV